MDFSHLLNDTVTVSTRTGEDVHGQPTYSAQQKVQARVETAYALSMSLHNESLNFIHAICLTNPLNPGDRVWIGSDDTTSTDAARLVLRSASAYDSSMTINLYMAYL